MEIVTKVMEKSWKSHGNLLVKMCTNPVKKMKNDVPGVLVTLIPGILSGWEILFILLHFLNPNKTDQNIPK